MQFIRYRMDGGSSVGLVDGNRVQPIEFEAAPRGSEPDVVDAVRGDWREAGDPIAWESIDVQAPVHRPRKMIGVGLNYRDHVIAGGYDVPDEPMIWAKATSAVIAHNEPVVYPRETNELDYEGELAIVIGEYGRRISEADAINYVAGFTVFNDISARDIQYAVSQVFRGKGFDTFAPMGPTLVTPDAIEYANATIRTTVNDELRQDSTTSEMIFPIEELIAFISRSMTLVPGDVISTGTPPGVGVHRDPPALLEPGDTVTVEIEGIGALQNPIVAESAEIRV